jgi:hypothetical protein
MGYNETKDENSEMQPRYVTRTFIVRPKKSGVPRKRMTTISISMDTRERIERLNKTHASFDVVLNEILDIVEKEIEKGGDKK